MIVPTQSLNHAPMPSLVTWNSRLLHPKALSLLQLLPQSLGMDCFAPLGPREAQEAAVCYGSDMDV